MSPFRPSWQLPRSPSFRPLCSFRLSCSFRPSCSVSPEPPSPPAGDSRRIDENDSCWPPPKTYTAPPSRAAQASCSATGSEPAADARPSEILVIALFEPSAPSSPPITRTPPEEGSLAPAASCTPSASEPAADTVIAGGFGAVLAAVVADERSPRLLPPPPDESVPTKIPTTSATHRPSTAIAVARRRRTARSRSCRRWSGSGGASCGSLTDAPRPRSPARRRA